MQKLNKLYCFELKDPNSTKTENEDHLIEMWCYETHMVLTFVQIDIKEIF